MALLLMDGFDVYAQTNIADANLNAQLRRLWLPNYWYSGVNLITAGRLGVGNDLYLYSDAGNGWFLEHDFVTPSATTVIIHMGYYCNQTASSSNAEILRISDANHAECGRLYFQQLSGPSSTNGYGQLNYRNSSGVNVASFVPPWQAAGFTMQQWYTIELKIVLGAGVAGSVEMHVEGQSIPPVTGINTVGTALATGMRWLSLGAHVNSTNWHNWYIDDLFVMDSSGTRLNDFTGPRKIRQLLPNGAGTYTQLALSGAAQNFAAVNEQGLNGDTSYTYSATPGQKDTYAIADPSAAVVTLEAIQVSGHARKDDVATKQAQLLLRTNAADQLVGPVATLTTDYTNSLNALLPINPVTGNPWTLAELTALEAGLQVIA